MIDNSKTLTLYFLFDRSTLGAYRYRECDENGKLLTVKDYYIGTLYIRKDRISGSPPKCWTMTLTRF